MGAAATLLWERQEARLASLDRLPRGLWLWSLIHSHGRLEPRLDGVAELRATLAAGCLPEGAGWPQDPLAESLRGVLRALDLPRYCDGQESLAEAVLRSLMFHLDLIVDYQDRGASAGEAETMALEAFHADWAERCGQMDELAAVFGEVGDLLKHTRWDMLRGLLKSGGWQEVVRASRLVERLPELAECIRRLGRARATDEPDEGRLNTRAVMEETVAPRPVRREVRVPDYPGETRGIRRSGRVARMLPAEAVLLLHPRLRLVWHARHAERALLTYEDQETLTEVHHEPMPAWAPSTERVPDRRLEMGPLLVCVDTSGSMQGGAETVAKAVVLEAARTAHRQRRPCHLFSFSGPGDLVQMEMTLDAEGLARLTDFMGQSFRGGTDITGAIGAALERLGEARWQLADLLIASDGEFGATPDQAEHLRQARDELGLRVQGVLIGDRETLGFLELADDIYWVRDWRRYGGGGGTSPVHSKSLTAMYFPGALRSPENLAGTVGGGEAADAVRRGATRER